MSWVIVLQVTVTAMMTMTATEVPVGLYCDPLVDGWILGVSHKRETTPIVTLCINCRWFRGKNECAAPTQEVSGQCVSCPTNLHAYNNSMQGMGRHDQLSANIALLSRHGLNKYYITHPWPIRTLASQMPAYTTLWPILAF
jgi:hypothetical protein